MKPYQALGIALSVASIGCFITTFNTGDRTLLALGLSLLMINSGLLLKVRRQAGK